MKQMTFAVLLMLSVMAIAVEKAAVPAVESGQKPPTAAPAVISRYSTTPAGWWDDFNGALKAAGELNRPLLVVFSGSDWCGWCVKLHNDVFATDTFKEFVQDKLVLLMLDIPRSKAVPDVQKQENQMLFEKMGGSGFPYAVLLDNRGMVKEKISGYLPLENFMQKLKRAL